LRPVGPLLRNWFDRSGMGTRARAALLLHDWPEIVGPAVAAHASAEKVERGVLIVRVESSVWATELSTRVPFLMERISATYGEGLVRGFRFVTGQGRGLAGARGRTLRGRWGVGAPHDAEIPHGAWPDRRDLEKVRLSDSERRLVARFRAAAKDPALARAGARWLTATLKARRWLAEAGRRRGGGE